ncbi:MAG: 5'-methylthioadenosine/S-adenosylhomocysteine nucleosidase [Lachnospiraceae bacterium]|nr:5'-methylthioadenosine/S-adenosylhomocysteine nucleosidase [Lachnospiraceae bacterium]
MKKIGMIVAVRKEIEAVLRAYGTPLSTEKRGGFEISVYRNRRYKLFVLESGIGEIGAAAAAQLLITGYGVEVVANFGVVGGLTPEMSLAKTCIVKSVVHYDMDTSPIDPVKPAQYAEFPDIYIPASEDLFRRALALEPGLMPVVCASGDKFVDTKEAKTALREQYGADICDMESAGIVLTCYRNRIPCILFKIVSDSITGGADEYRRMTVENGDVCLSVVTRIASEG